MSISAAGMNWTVAGGRSRGGRWSGASDLTPADD